MNRTERAIDRNIRTLTTNKRIGHKKRYSRYIPLYLMMVPALAYLLINNFLPMFGIVIAFKNITNYNGILGLLSNKWAGLSNFEFLFKSSDALLITKNTVFYNIIFIVFGTLIAIIFALLLNEVRSRIYSRIYQSLIILPALISMVVVSYLVYSGLSLESGFFNKTILPLLGINPISWYSEPKYWPYILTAVYLWKNVGFNCIIYFAAIVGISPDYYEAAKLDGATKWRQILHITIPAIQPVIIMLTILNIGRIFYSDFGLFYQVPRDSGMLYSTTNTIDTYVFRGLMKLGDVGMSSAAGAYQSLVGFVLVLFSNMVVKKSSKENALF